LRAMANNSNTLTKTNMELYGELDGAHPYCWAAESSLDVSSFVLRGLQLILPSIAARSTCPRMHGRNISELPFVRCVKIVPAILTRGVPMFQA